MLCIQSQCSGGKISRVGIFFFVFVERIVDAFKIRVRDGCFAAHHQMPFVCKAKREAGKSLFHKCDVCANSSVSAGKNFCQGTVVIC